MAEATITVSGNVASTPVSRSTRDGTVVTSFRLASTPRRRDRVSGEWKDGETLWLDVTCWRSLAEHVGASLAKGDAVVVVGRLQARRFDTREGERTVTEVDAASVSVDLGRATLRTERRQREDAARDGDDAARDSEDAARPDEVGAGPVVEPAA